jgi:hypothetical protein
MDAATARVPHGAVRPAAALAAAAALCLPACSWVESVEERDAFRSVDRARLQQAALPVGARDRLLDAEVGPAPKVRALRAAGAARRPIKPGSLLIVTMTATAPGAPVQRRTAAVLWPAPPGADLPVSLRGPARDAPACHACRDEIGERLGAHGRIGPHARAVTDFGRLGVPDEWIARWAVGDRVEFAAPPPPWHSINAAALEHFDPILVADRGSPSGGNTVAKVAWSVDFACEADVREVVYRYVGLDTRTTVALPTGVRYARWWEFRGCRDGQAPPEGFAPQADLSTLIELRESP